ncbi:MAG: hypothetical protein HC806_06895 [Anaerolineae bacterium]|nr:hypothetical protein [Anaerolineae bacterium]
MVVKALRAHLNLGCAQMPEPSQLVRGNVIRAGFDHQPTLRWRAVSLNVWAAVNSRGS